jgi:hypothetical protein
MALPSAVISVENGEVDPEEPDPGFEEVLEEELAVVGF